MASLLKLTVGVVYKFYFIEGYKVVDGVYRLQKIMTFDEALRENADLLHDFYLPNSKDINDYQADLPALRASRILKLNDMDRDINSPLVRFVPEDFLACIPDHNVKQYFAFGIISDVGVVKDITTLEYVRDNIVEQVAYATGIDIDPKYVSLSQTWMTDKEFEDMITEREKDKKVVINYFTECKRLEKRLLTADQRVHVYEKLATQLQQTIDATNYNIGTIRRENRELIRQNQELRERLLVYEGAEESSDGGGD